MHRSVVCAKTVLVVAVVNGDFDGHRGINQADDRGRYTDEVGVPAVRSTSESVLAGVSACRSTTDPKGD